MRLRSQLAPEPALRGPLRALELEPPTHGIARLIRETPAQMRDLVQVLGPVAVFDLIGRELIASGELGWTRADLESAIHQRYHGAWRFWGPERD